MSDITERAKEALEGVTPGWEVRDEFIYPLSIRCGVGGIWKRDAEFIAAARTLVPELVAEVERLRDQIGSRGKWNPEWGSPYDVMGEV